MHRNIKGQVLYTPAPNITALNVNCCLENNPVDSRLEIDRHGRRCTHQGNGDANQRADHAEGRRAVADRAIDLLARAEMDEEVVAVALEGIANEIRIVTVGDEPHPGDQERVADLLLWRPIGPCLLAISARRAISSTSSREVQRRFEKANFMPSGKPWKGVQIQEHPQVAAHRDKAEENDASEHEPQPDL